MAKKPLAFIIEDNQDQNLIFTTAMEKAGYETESIHEGQVAEKRLSEVVPDIILLDLHLPGVHGRQLLTQIRRDPKLASIRTILTTADAALADQLKAQADLVLLKPISFAQLNTLASRFITSAKSD